MNKKEQIKHINEAYEAKMAEINERRDYRMRNYLDCLDDYCVGGLCDKADSMAAHRAGVERDILLQQVKNGGYFVQKASEYILLNQEDKVVSENLFWGKYGLCFRTNDNTYVGVPKTLATLTKKGYRVARVDREFRCVFGGWSDKGNIIYKSMELMSEERVMDDLPTTAPDTYINWFYSTINK